MIRWLREERERREAEKRAEPYFIESKFSKGDAFGGAISLNQTMTKNMNFTMYKELGDDVIDVSQPDPLEILIQRENFEERVKQLESNGIRVNDYL